MKTVPWTKLWLQQIGAVSGRQVQISTINNLLRNCFGCVPCEVYELGIFLMEMVECHEETRALFNEQFIIAGELRLVTAEEIITNFLTQLPYMKIAPPEDLSQPIVDFDKSVDRDLQFEADELDFFE